VNTSINRGVSLYSYPDEGRPAHLLPAGAERHPGDEDAHADRVIARAGRGGYGPYGLMQRITLHTMG
jgi:hypothetical protein